MDASSLIGLLAATLGGAAIGLERQWSGHIAVASGGIVSSTSVTLRFARDSRAERASRIALSGGVIGASTVMLARVVLASAVLNPRLAMALPRYVAPAFLVMGIMLAIH